MEEKEIEFSKCKENSHRCKNFKINEIEEAFCEISENKRLSYVNQAPGMHKQGDLGFVFLVHDDNTANKLALFRYSYNETKKQEDNTNLIKIPNISYNISLTIRSHEDIDILNRYLRDVHDKFDGIFVLCFTKDDMLHRIQDSLSTLGYKYVLMDNTVLDRDKEYIEKELSIFLDIDNTVKFIETMTNDVIPDNLKPSKCISTGFADLDKKLGYGGLLTGRLYALGGITGVGKTTLALNIADNIAKSGNDVIIFSLEMSRYELMSKVYSRNMNMLNENTENGFSKTAIEIMDFNVTTKEDSSWSYISRDLLSKAKEECRRYAKHLMISECTGEWFGVNTIKEKLRILRTLGRMPKVVIVDYLQILSSKEHTEKQAIDKNILELKKLSRDFNIAIIAISSFNRSAYESEADFKSFKESGAIEYSCDVVFALQLKLSNSERESIKERDTSSDIRACIDKKISSSNKLVEIYILKNRLYKSRNKVDFCYYSKYDSFEESTNQPSEPQDIDTEKWKRTIKQ